VADRRGADGGDAAASATPAAAAAAAEAAQGAAAQGSARAGRHRPRVPVPPSAGLRPRRDSRTTYAASAPGGEESAL